MMSDINQDDNGKKGEDSDDSLQCLSQLNQENAKKPRKSRADRVGWTSLTTKKKGGADSPFLTENCPKDTSSSKSVSSDDIEEMLLSSRMILPIEFTIVNAFLRSA